MKNTDLQYMKQMYIYLIAVFLFFFGCSGLDFSESLEAGCTLNADEEIECFIEKVELFSVGDLENRPLDFIFVIDASGSMDPDLLKLGQGFQHLISKIEPMAWRMMFTLAWSEGIAYADYTGDKPFNGQFMKPEYQGSLISQYYLDKETPNYEQAFLDTLTRANLGEINLPPYSHRGDEQPLRSLKFAFERLADNKAHTHLKEGADVVVVIITDEDETAGVSAEQVIAVFEEHFPDKQLLAFAVLIKPEDPACLSQQSSNNGGGEYGAFTSQLPIRTEGQNISICEVDYSASLEAFSRLILASQEDFKLEHRPDSKEDVKVRFIYGTEVDWEIVGRKIKFERALDPGTTLEVRYFIREEQDSAENNSEEEEEEAEEEEEEEEEEDS